MTRRAALLLAGAAAVVLLPLAGAAVALASLDPAVVKARIIQQVQLATGRSLTIAGPLHIRLLPELVVDATDVALGNPAAAGGAAFSRPAMVTARQVHAALALLPLLGHQVVLRELVLTAPDLRMERAGGIANWRFRPAPADRQPPPQHHSGWLPRLRLDRLTVLGVTIADGLAAWRDPAGDQAGAIVAVPHARLQEVNASSTIFVDLTAVLAGEPVRLTGRLGGQSHLWNAADRAEWPVDLRLHADAGDVAVLGALTQPRTLSGYDVTLTAHGPDLGRLAAVVPSLQLPRLRDVTAETRLVDRPQAGQGAAAPGEIDMPRLTLTAGASDLGASVPGLSLDRLAIAAPNIDGTNGVQVNHVQASGRYAGQALQLDATLGPIGRLFGRGQAAARSAVTLDATAAAAGATLAVHGRAAPWGNWAGTDVTLLASIPDLHALSSLAGRPLPALTGITLGGAAQSTGGELRLRDMHLALPQAELHVDGTARLAGRPAYVGTVAIARLDLDALRTAWQALPRPAAAPASPATPPPGEPPAAPGWLIPDMSLPFARLGGLDADLTLQADHLRHHGVEIASLAGHVRLLNGRLDVDPATASVGGATAAGTLSIDITKPAPAVALDLRAQGLALPTLLALAGQPAADAAGTLDVDAALAGSGTTLHRLAGTLDGHLGVALTGASLDNATLTGALELLLPVAHLGLGLPSGGRSTIACLATRLDVTDGVASPRAFFLDAGRLRLTAAGAIDLRAETFALRLRPYVKLGSIGLVLPSRADGPWRTPALTLEPASGAAGAAALAGTLLAGRHGGAISLPGLSGTADALLADATGGDCTPALAAARDQAGDAPPPTVTLPDPAPTRRERAYELLRHLFGRPG